MGAMEKCHFAQHEAKAWDKKKKKRGVCDQHYMPSSWTPESMFQLQTTFLCSDEVILLHDNLKLMLHHYDLKNKN